MGLADDDVLARGGEVVAAGRRACVDDAGADGGEGHDSAIERATRGRVVETEAHRPARGSRADRVGAAHLGATGGREVKVIVCAAGLPRRDRGARRGGVARHRPSRPPRDTPCRPGSSSSYRWRSRKRRPCRAGRHGCEGGAVGRVLEVHRAGRAGADCGAHGDRALVGLGGGGRGAEGRGRGVSS